MPNYEQFGINAASTLTAGINDTVTSLTVTATTGFPTTGNFRIVIESEIMIVTSVSGSVFTIVRAQDGTTAAAHGISKDVIQVVSAESLAQFLKESVPFSRDTVRPKMNTLVNAAGSILTKSDFTWVNQGGATTTDLTSGGITLSVPTTAGNSIRGMYKSSPGTPYILTTAFTPRLHAASTCIVGIGFRENSSGKLIILGSAKIDEIAIYKFNSATSFNTSLFSRAGWPMGRNLQWFQIEDDGTTIYFRTSMDGINFHTIASEARGNFFTTAPDQLLFYGNTNSSSFTVGLSLVAWQEA